MNKSTKERLGLLKSLSLAGRHEELVTEAREAADELKKNGEYIEAGMCFFYLGFAIGELGDAASAIEYYGEAERLGFRSSSLYFNMGNALRNVFRPRDALVAFKKCRDINPRDTRVDANMAFSYEDLGDISNAEKCFRAGAELNRNNKMIVNNLSYSLLRKGDFREGWELYELREIRTVPGLEANWRVDKSVIGAKILLIAEQGYGDVLMFCSLIEELKLEASHVTLLCDSVLYGLLTRCLSIEVIKEIKKEKIQSYTYRMGIASLGYLYRNSAQSYSMPVKEYLRPREDLVKEIKSRGYLDEQKLNVGITWKGGSTIFGINRRSLDMNSLKAILSERGISWFNLQHHCTEEEINEIEKISDSRLSSVVDVDNDFEATAALVSELDYVVTVQQTIVHVAGLLGVETSVLVPFVPEWRYGKSGDRMLWYRSVKVHRQGTLGNWDSAVDECLVELKKRKRKKGLGV